MKRRYVDELRYQRRIASRSGTRVNAICEAAGNVDAALEMWSVRKRHLCSSVAEILGADDSAVVALRDSFDSDDYPPLANYLFTGASS
ncbi:hypothetical protein QZM48_04135 [Burkholderia orbicola]|uniref:hypothetical protein n=1 Tax=Burkholderia orbicola TaxID=2978683 RepID=UPI00265688EF|nr:hypothetical protein [Burkholderia orbicola]MDN7729195.1 hypothetical protein [Burkholderia orbicola]